jgi:hypothetical protein
MPSVRTQGIAASADALSVLDNVAYEFSAYVLALSPYDLVGAIARWLAVAVEQQHELIERLVSIELQANAFDRGIGHEHEAWGNTNPELDGGEAAEAMTRVPSPFLDNLLLTLLKIGRTHDGRLRLRGGVCPGGRTHQ